MKLAIQLYTLRDIIRDEETLADALLHLRQMGYEGVEFAGLYDIPAPRVRQIVEQAGMHALSCHVSLDAMEQELDGVLEDARVLGLDTVAMAWSAADSPEAVAARSVCCRRRSQRRSRMGCASCTTTIPMSCAPWTAARRCRWSISCRLCRWRRICTGCFTRGWTLRAFCARTTAASGFCISRTEKNRSPCPVRWAKERPISRRFALPQQTAARNG